MKGMEFIMKILEKDITEFTENDSSIGFEKEWERKKRLFARKKKNYIKDYY